MSDRELLELAAKAAGMKSHRYCEAWKAMAAYTLQDGYHGPSWDPLTDDGDALRLAVKLRIHIQPSATTDDLAPSVECYDTEDVYSEVFEVRLGDDPYAATRRAIVRAAASLGEKM